MYAYLMVTENKKFVKIGISRDPKSRLKQISSGCPYFLTINVFYRISFKRDPSASSREGHKTEKEIFQALKEYKIVDKSEWFNAGENFDYIRNVFLSFKKEKENAKRTRVAKEGSKEKRSGLCGLQTGIP